MLLDLDHIRDASVRPAPFPFFVVPLALRSDRAADIAAAFPTIERPGAVGVDQVDQAPLFATLLDDLRSDAFRAIIADKLDLDLDQRDIVINVRGQVRLTDGNIHTDTPSKLATVLLYFDRPGDASDTGLRILRGNKNLDDFVEEIPSTLGTMLVFKVTPDCWHGHKPHVGRRHSLQLNYLSGVKTIGKHQLLHRLIGRTKRKFNALR
ncbi:hypothetical protein [Sphingomonas sp.]|uniref:hypothetical protein n=1 Tax=Sphingomonas sp. TaxID=28214 RepID=UPI00286AE65F|nr:hypothetical protein [Sphingomonas sp.]